MASYFCGIDIGNQTLTFSFLSEDTLVSYYGPVERMVRYELGKEPTVVDVPMKKTSPSGEKLIKHMEAIPELQRTKAFIVEFQMNNQAFTFMAGVIYGYLCGKGIPGNTMGGQTRKNFATLMTADDPMTQTEIKAKSGHKVVDSKVASVGFVIKRFPAYFDLILEHERGKFDDICDGVVYAYMCQQEIRTSATLAKVKKAIVKATT